MTTTRPTTATDAVATKPTPAAATTKRLNIPPETYKTDSAYEKSDPASLLKMLKRDNPNVLKAKLHAYRNKVSAEDDDDDGSASVVKFLSQLRIVMDTVGEDDDRLFMVATSAIWAVCSKSDHRKHETAETGCLELIVDSLASRTDDPELVAWSLGTISSCAKLDDNRLMIAQKGGIERIVEVLSKHESDVAVFEWACRALTAMVTLPHSVYDRNEPSEEENPALERNMTVIVDSGGIKAVVSAMEQHTSHPNAEWWAFRLLSCLLDQPNDAVVASIVNQMIQANMTRACTNILKARPTTTELIILNCEVLRLLLSSDTNPASGIDCISSVLRALGEKNASVELKASGAHVLAEIARGDNLAKKRISESSTFRALINSLSSKLDHKYLVRSIMLLLCVLSCDETSFDYSLLESIKASIEAIDQKYPNDLELNTLICEFVANNATISQGQPDSVPVDVVMRIYNSLRASSIPQCCRALAVVSAGDKLLENGGIERLLDGLVDPSVDVKTFSCGALSGLIEQSQEAADQVVNDGGLAKATAILIVADSEPLTGCVLELVSAMITNTSQMAIQFPNDLFSGIVRAIQNFPNIARSACVTTRNAMLKAVPGFNLPTNGLAQALAGILDNPANSDEIVIEACGAVWAYCAKQPVSGDDLSLLFASCLGLCARHKGEGEASPFNSAVLTEAAGALSAAMYCVRENPVLIPDTGIDMIISVFDLAIECDVDNVVIMDRMLDVVLTLCFLVKETLIQCGVIVVVIDCMVEHERNETIQQKGCAILALLASTENLQINLSIAETDGIDMLVSALAGFSENSQIQTDACRALSHLSIDHESRMLISSQGGFILLVNAMTKYPNETDLLEAACGALLNLSSDAEEPVLASSNVVATVIKTMQQNAVSPKLQEKSLGVLQNVSMRSKDSKKMIGDAGGIGAVAYSIKEFMGSPSVMERAFTTMWSLAVSEENQVRIAEEQGIGLIVNGMMANITYEKVQKQACGCLCTLSTNSRNKTLVREQGGVDAIVYAMWAHYTSDAVLIEACRALSSLAVNVQTNEVMIASEGEINAILAAMRRFPNSERLQEHACVAMRNFMLSSDNTALVRNQQAELEGLMNVASTRYPDRCRERARQVLESLLS